MEIKDNETIGLKTVIVNYLLHWKLFLAVFLVSLIPAVLYLIYYPRTYEMMARIQIQDDKDLGGGSFGLGEAAGLMKSFGLSGVSGGSINIEDELMALTSNNLVREMVLELGINVEYSEPYTWGYRLYKESPFVLTTDSLTNTQLTEEIEWTVARDKNKIQVTAQSNQIEKMNFTFDTLPAEIRLPSGTFTLNYAEGKEQAGPARLNILYRPAQWVAEDLIDEFLIEEVSKSSNVIELSCTEYEKARGVDMLNTLIRRYNKQSENYKKDEARKSLVFLDGRIEGIITELADIENKIERYKSQHNLTDIEHDVEFYVDQMKELQVKLIELQAQANVVDMMENFVKNPANKYNLVPVLLSTQDGEKGSPLTSYNEILLERARVIQNSSINNPLVATLSKQADELRESVVMTISNAQKGLQLSIEDLRGREKLLLGKMNSYPVQERQFIELKRNQEITQGVYLILLQKREETALILGQGREKARVLDYAYVKSKPVAPRKLYAAIGILLFTLVIPIGFLFVRDQFHSLRKEYQAKAKK